MLQERAKQRPTKYAAPHGKPCGAFFISLCLTTVRNRTIIRKYDFGLKVKSV